MTMFSDQQIDELVKREVLWDGMQLEDLGHSFDDLSGDTILLGERGLGLDSVDSLEIVVKLQKVFGITIGEVSKEFFETHLRTIDTVAAFVKSRRDSA